MPSLVKRLLINKDDWAFPIQYHGIFNAEEAHTNEEVTETIDILSMMGFIESSVSQLNDAERPEFEGNDLLKFRGFDGNNDPHFSIAHTLINDLDRFSEFVDRPLNSHSRSTLSIYRRLLPHYRDMLSGTHGGLFTADRLRILVDALEDRSAS